VRRSEGGAAGVDLAMERYASGDEAAFAEIYDALRPRLLAYVRRQIRDTNLAEDIVQQAFLQMHRARGQFIRGAEVLPWAFAITRHLITDFHRRRRDWSQVSTADSADSDAAEEQRWRQSGQPSADEVLDAQRAADRVELEISRLPAAQRAAFELLKEDGLSLSQAAKVLGTTITAVKLRSHRAKLALRAALCDLAEGKARK
jgi:RNA polymerase sigma-70 factor, ECF subfamily